MAAVRSLTSREVRLATVLMSLRGLPAAILRPRSRWARSDRILDAPLIEHFTRGGFVVLADRPDELVLSAVGRFWKLEGDVRRVSADEFASFDEPGFAKAVVNLHARAVDGGTVLSTETRVKLTDARPVARSGATGGGDARERADPASVAARDQEAGGTRWDPARTATLRAVLPAWVGRFMPPCGGISRPTPAGEVPRSWSAG
jgi:hypothetical protein